MELVKMIKGDYKNYDAVEKVIRYTTNPEKTEGYIGACGMDPFDPEHMIVQMHKVKRAFEKEKGYRQVKHFVVSFPDSGITKEQALRMAEEIATFYKSRYQICYAVHSNTENLHIHFVMNTVSYIDGRLYSEGIMELIQLKQHVNQVVTKYSRGTGNATSLMEWIECCENEI